MRTRSRVHVCLFAVLCLAVAASLAGDQPASSPAGDPQAWEDRAGDELRGEIRKLRKLEKKKSPDPEKLITALLAVGRGYRDIGGYLPTQHYLGKALALADTSQVEPPLMAGILDMLGNGYFLADDPAKALELYERSLRSMEQAFGPIHPARGIGLCKKGAVLGALGRYREGEAAIMEAVEIIYETVGPASKPEVQAWETIAELHLAQGRLSRAHDFLQYALSVRSGQITSSAAMQMPPKRLLGVLYAMAGLWEEAEPYLEDVLEVADSEGMDRHPDLEQICLVMAAVQKALGHAEDAEAFRERAAGIHTANAGFSHPLDRPLAPRWNLRQGAEGTPGALAGAQVGDWVTYHYAEDDSQDRIEVARVTGTAVVLRTSQRASATGDWGEPQTDVVGLTETMADIIGLQDARVEPGTFRWGSTELEGQVATLEYEGDDGRTATTAYYYAPGVIPLWGTVRVEEEEGSDMELVEYQFAGKEKQTRR